MDESLSDFQEKKPTLSGPKKSEKPATKKSRTKKPPKRIRGQKDIRTVLNKKNELIKYSEDFDKVCKKSGLDVDSEQLQLAIALSKSLQPSEDSDPQCSTSQSSQDRQVKIRTTLKEYGFKVPEVKITAPKNKKRKSKLHYKLISVTESEKKQIISDKYAQVLFETDRIVKSIETKDVPETSLFSKATNISYNTIKSNDVFYVDKLIDKNTNSVGSLLRDWSEIPGRPSSPIKESVNINFDDIDCTENELDNILSGTMEVAQQIIRNKHVLLGKESKNKNLRIVKIVKKIEMENEKGLILIDDDSIEINEKSSKTIKEGLSEDLYKSSSNSNLLKVPEMVNKQTRSCSPDIFDDDVTIIDDSFTANVISQKRTSEFQISEKIPRPINVYQENLTATNESEANILSSSNIVTRKSNNFTQIAESKCGNDLSQKTDTTKRKSDEFMEVTDVVCGNILSQQSQRTNYTNRKSHSVMEITECQGVNILSLQSHSTNKSNRKTDDFMELTDNVGVNIISQPSQRVDTTKRKTNDFMEITECIAVSPHKLNKEERVDLTQTPFCEDVESSVMKNERIDLTQSSNTSDDTLPFVDIGGVNKSIEGTTTLRHANRTDHNIDKETNSTEEEIMLSSGDSATKQDTTPFKTNLTKTNVKENNIPLVMTKKNLDSSSVMMHCEINLDISPEQKNSFAKSKTQSFFEEFSYQHSDESSKENNTIGNKNSEECQNQSDLSENISKVSECSVDLTQTHELPVNVDFNDDIDLTQSTDSSVNGDEIKGPEIKSSNNAEQLGKINNVSVDYDEVYFNGATGNISVDYDELFDNVVDNHNSGSKSNSCSKHKEFNSKSESKESNNELNSSQNSEVFEISDNELDYSIQKSRRENFDIGGISSIIGNMSSMQRSKSINDLNNDNTEPLEDSVLPEIHMQSSKEMKTDSYKRYSNSQPTLSKHKTVEEIVKECSKTPLDQKYVVKMNDVTPIVDYATLTTPEITKELDRYGVKPLKRRRAVQLLTHIYNQTHPKLESCSEDIVSASKKLKTCHVHSQLASPLKEVSPKKCKKKSPRNLPLSSTTKNTVELPTTESDKENCIYEVTNEMPDVRNLDCSEEDWVFQKREKAKLQSCRVPLHIAFHNYLSARRRLREAILRYEPVNIDVIHKGLVANGFRYDPKDLLRYMDKKCITVKTAESNGKNRKHY